MHWTVLLAIIVGVPLLTWLADRVGLVDLSNKATKSGGSGGVASMMDEVFAPTRHEAQSELERQARLPQESPTPAGDPHDLLSGRVLITVPRTSARRDANPDHDPGRR